MGKHQKKSHGSTYRGGEYHLQPRLGVDDLDRAFGEVKRRYGGAWRIDIREVIV
jgi:hypothetical protein